MNYLIIIFLSLSSFMTQAEPIRKLTLSNGLEVILLKDKNLPYVQYELMVEMGSKDDPKDQEGLSYFVSQMLLRGTSKREASLLASELDNLGTSFSSTTRRDYSSFHAGTLSWNHDRFLEIFSDIISNPSFLDKEVSWLKKQTISQIEKLPESDSVFTDRVLVNLLFKNKEYQHSPIGSIQYLQKIKSKDIVEHYKTYLTPDRATLGITGQYPDNIKKRLEEAFKNWKGPKGKVGFFESLKQTFFQEDKKKIKKETSNKKIKTSDIPSYLIVSKKGQVQSTIRVGKNIRLHRSSPDYLPFQIANIILGGGTLNSRLFEKVRGEEGLTYSIRSQLRSILKDGIFYISTPTRLAVTKQACDLILDVMDSFYKNSITQEEFEQAKRTYKIQLLHQSETAENRMSRRMFLKFYDVRYDLDNIHGKLKKVKIEDVHRVIKKYFEPTLLQFVIFTDYSKVKPQFKDVPLIELKTPKNFL